MFLVIQMVLISPEILQEGDEVKSTPLEATETTNFDQIMRDVHLTEAGRGQKEWELWAKEAKSLKDKNQWEMEQVRALFFSDDGSEFTVTGNKGMVHTQTKDMVVSGNVEIRSNNGYLFKTEVVNYSSQNKKLTSTEPLEMFGPVESGQPSLTLKGVGFEGSLGDSVMNVLDQVRATQSFRENKKAFIRSKRARFSGNKKMAEFFEDVIITYDEMRITGPIATFHYDSEKKLVDSMVVDGGIRVNDHEKWATSKKVEVDFLKEKYIFKGNPRVVQANDELVGQEIVFFDGGKRVQVKSARARVDESRVEENNGQ